MTTLSNTKDTVIASANEQQRRGALTLLPALFVLLLLVVFVSLTIGSYSLSLHDWAQVLRAPMDSGIPSVVLLQVRIPRLLVGMLIGGGLAMAGAAYQGLFNNPMVSPDILGASAGAGFGAALGILCGFSIVSIQFLSFAAGLIAVLLAYGLASGLARRGDPILMLVLVGILIGSVFASLISITKYIADPYNKLPAITFWLMGSLAAITPKDAELGILPILAGSIPLLLFRWRLNVLCFGEEEAQSLGLNTRRLRTIVIVCATLITSSAVSICGMVGWIGLVVPHLARMLVGPNHKVLLPASAIIGACFLLIVDDVARSAFALEIPVGVLTALIGAPFFLFLLLREQKAQA